MNKLDKKQSGNTPENWDELRPEALLFATEVCMMDRDTKVIRIGDSGGYGALAGTVFGFVLVIMLLGLFQIIDNIQTPNQITYTDFSPWKTNRIKSVTMVNIGPATPPKPAVVAAPPKPPVATAPPEPKPVVETAKTEATAKAEEEAAAKAEEEAAKAEAAAKAEEEAAKAEAAAKAEEEAANKAEAAAKAEEEAAKAEAAAKAEEEAAKAEAAAKAEEEAAKAEAAAKAEEEAAKVEAAAKAEEEAAKAEAAAKAATAVNHEAAIVNAVTGWANAWSNQNIDTYINSYASDFKPKQYKSRQYWEDQRRKRLSRPSRINIQLSNIQVSLAEDGNATVTFVQIYKSPSFTDQVRKTLILKQESGSWKISSETAKPL